LDPQAVKDITFEYIGKIKVDVEVYTLSSWFMGGWWQWFDGFYDLMPGDKFKVDGSTLAGGVLTDRIMMRVYDASTGKLLDTVYIRSSGEWFLEVEPGNMYGDFEIIASTLILGNSTEWDEWWGGDMVWWDWFFGFWYWEDKGYGTRCGWVPEECFDSEAAAEEQARICSNVTKLKQLINMLVIADQILAEVSIRDAENTTVMDAENQDEYMYHLQWAKRYWSRGYDRQKKGRAYDAINDYMASWRHSVLAIKWALKGSNDPNPEDSVEDPCGCFKEGGCDGSNYYGYPWWMHWYLNLCDQCCNENNNDCCCNHNWNGNGWGHCFSGGNGHDDCDCED
jgi:hypothetical protein